MEQEINDKIASIRAKINKIASDVTAAPGQTPAPKKKEREPSPYDVRREDIIDTTKSFAQDAYDSIFNAIDSLAMFKIRIETALKKPELRINPENAQKLMSQAVDLEKALETIATKSENMMIALEGGQLG